MTAPLAAFRYVIACWSFLIVVRDSSRRPPRWTRSARPMTISSRLRMGIRSRRGALVDDSYAVSAAPIRSPAAGTSMRTESRCSNRRRPSHQRQNSAALRLQRPALADDRQPPIAMERRHTHSDHFDARVPAERPLRQMQQRGRAEGGSRPRSGERARKHDAELSSACDDHFRRSDGNSRDGSERSRHLGGENFDRDDRCRCRADHRHNADRNATLARLKPSRYKFLRTPSRDVLKSGDVWVTSIGVLTRRCGHLSSEIIRISGVSCLWFRSMILGRSGFQPRPSVAILIRLTTRS